MPSKSDQDEKKQKEVEKKADEKKVMDEVTATLKEMQTQNIELKEMVKGVVGQGVPSPQSSTKNSSVAEQLQKIEIAELKADIKKLKAMMLDSKSSKSYGQNSATPVGWAPSSEPKLPSWMEKDSGKNPLSFDDPYGKMLEKAQNRGSTEGSAVTTLEEGMFSSLLTE